MRQNGHSGLALPHQVTVQLVPHSGPHAQAVSVAIPAATGMEVHTWGGLSALQASAIQIAAGLLAGLSTIPEDPNVIADASVHIAAATLNAANNYRPPNQENSDG